MQQTFCVNSECTAVNGELVQQALCQCSVYCCMWSVVAADLCQLSRSARESLLRGSIFPPFEAYSMLSSLDWAPWRGEGDGRGSLRFRVVCLLFVRTLLSTTLSGVHLLSLSTSVAGQQQEYTTPVWFS